MQRSLFQTQILMGNLKNFEAHCLLRMDELEYMIRDVARDSGRDESDNNLPSWRKNHNGEHLEKVSDSLAQVSLNGQHGLEPTAYDSYKKVENEFWQKMEQERKFVQHLWKQVREERILFESQRD